jgi:xanthine dehydrogenase accessory factor
LSGNHHWTIELQGLLAQQPCVLVTLNQIMGSAPRESGCRMIVSADAIHGSIGGGNLEYMAIQQARDWLQQSHAARQQHQPIGLGPALNQCCGGAVSLHFEMLPAEIPQWLADLDSLELSNTEAVLATRVDGELPEHRVINAASRQPQSMTDEVWREVQSILADATGSAPMISVKSDEAEWWLEAIHDQRQELYLFGAGHVGQQVARLLQGLPFRLTWADQRPDIFPAMAKDFCRLRNDDPLAVVSEAHSGSVFVVMTHSHQLDEDICEVILHRDDPDWDFAWLGLIGSVTKRKRFVHRLKQKGIADQQLQRLICPIGLAGIHGKQPATIALSLVAQLMMRPNEEAK